MTQEEFDSLYNRILSALLANSKMATDLRVVESPAGVNLLPGILGGELVALAAQTLKGTDGKNIYLQKTDTAIQWKSGVEGEWVNLILLSDISGSDGRSVVFRDGATGIEWKYDDEPDTAYRLIVSYDELKLTFADLTAEQKQELKPTLADFSAEEISQLQQPATDAAKVVLQEMVQIEEKANLVIECAEEAAGKAETAAGNVKDGKTPVLGMVNAQSGDTPSGSFVSDGVDDSGNPKYTLNLTLPAGKDGQPAIFEQGISTTLEPTEEARVEVVENGETAEGNPKYILNFFIPRGQVGKPGEGSGNVSAEGTGLVIGKKYLFVPDSDGSTSGSFVEYIAPEAYDDSSLRTVIANNLTEAKTYTNDQIAGIVQFDIVVVDSLPGSGVKGTIYLIPRTGSNNDVHDEYIWIESTRGYELIGTTSVDLSDYYTRTQANDTFINRNGDSVVNPLTFNQSVNGTNKNRVYHAGLNITPLPTSNATGVNWSNQEGSSQIGGFGAHTVGNSLINLYMGWGSEPWNTPNNFRVNSDGLYYKDKPVYHEGNKAQAYPAYREWIENGPNRNQTICVLGDDNTYYPHKISFHASSLASQTISRFFVHKKLNSPSGNWSGNHSNGTSSCIGVWEFRASGWDGNANLFNTLYLSEPYAKLVGKITYGTGDWTGIVIWLRGSSKDSGAEYTLRTDDGFTSIEVADQTKFPPITVDEVYNNSGGVLGSSHNFSIGRLRSYDNELTYGNNWKVWHEINDGAGSGLDADKLDGLESTDFVRFHDGIVASNYPDRVSGYGYQTDGWPENGPAFTFGVRQYTRQIHGNYGDNNLRMRAIIDGSPAAWRNFAFEDQIPNSDSLLSAEQKAKLDRMGSITTATTVTKLDVNFESISVTLSANDSLSVNLTGASYNGWETHVFVRALSADRTVTIPTYGNYVSMCGNSVIIRMGQWCEFNLRCIDNAWHIAKLEQE